MAQYKVSPLNKKSIEEREFWELDGTKITHVTVWRGGSVWLYTKQDQNLTIDPDNADGLLVSDCGYDYELDGFWDGVYEDWQWSDDINKQQQETIMAAWDEDGYCGLENLGWVNTETETWFFGALEIEATGE